MAGNIKGITIEFRGDTTKLDKALRQIQNSTKDIDKELKNVDRALKFNPTSVELWRQKQDLLKQKIKETEKNLNDLKNIQSQMDADEVDKNSEAYRRVQREIIEAESKLKTFEGQLKKIGNVNLRATSEQFKEIGNKLDSAGRSMQGLSTAAAAVTAAIGALTVKSGKWADDMNTMSKVYRISTKDLQKYAAAADLVDVDVETIAKSHVKLEKTMSSAAKGTGASAEAFDKLGIAVVDSNGELRKGDDVWQDVIQALGNVENETERDAIAMQLMGKSASELNPLIEDGGKAYENLANTLQKYDLDFIDQKTLDNANAFNDSLDTIKAVGMVAFQQLGTQLAAYLAPAMEKVVDAVGKLANWFSKLSPKTQAIVAGVAAVAAVLAPLLIGLGKVSFAISSIMSLMATLGPAIAGIGATMLPVIAIIGALIAIGVLLYKNWDTIKAKALALLNQIRVTFNNIKTAITTAWNNIKTATLNAWNSIKTTITNAITNALTSIKTKASNIKTTLSDAWTSIKTRASDAWNSIKDKIVSPFESAKEKISGIISKIKGFFPISIGNIFSNLKTPHFSLNTSSIDLGKLGTIKYPTGINVSWYAQGGIFDSPTLAGIGESGAEAVVPLDKFWDKMDKIAEGSGQQIVINVNGSNKDPREIAEEVKRVLIKETNNRRWAWQ